MNPYVNIALIVVPILIYCVFMYHSLQRSLKLLRRVRDLERQLVENTGLIRFYLKASEQENDALEDFLARNKEQLRRAGYTGIGFTSLSRNPKIQAYMYEALSKNNMVLGIKTTKTLDNPAPEILLGPPPLTSARKK